MVSTFSSRPGSLLVLMAPWCLLHSSAPGWELAGPSTVEQSWEPLAIPSPPAWCPGRAEHPLQAWQPDSLSRAPLEPHAVGQGPVASLSPALPKMKPVVALGAAQRTGLGLDPKQLLSKSSQVQECLH